MAEKHDQTIVEMTIVAPVEAVWQALRQPGQMLNWFGWDADTLRDEIQFIFFDHAAADEANKVLAFGEHEGIADRVELRAAPGGTVLRVVRNGPEIDDWDAFYEDTWEGWITFFQQLRFLLERHQGAQRRTIFLSGKLPADAALPIAALGLAAGAIGNEVSFAIGGEAIRGKVWHRSNRQVGLAIAAWSDALLVVTDKPAPNGGPSGGGSVLVTTFELTEGAFAALEHAWKAWWGTRFPQD